MGPRPCPGRARATLLHVLLEAEDRPISAKRSLRTLPGAGAELRRGGEEDPRGAQQVGDGREACQAGLLIGPGLLEEGLLGGLAQP